MAHLVMDYVTRRRVAREQAEAIRLFALAQEEEDAPGASAEDQGALVGGGRSASYASLPYTPSCCSEKAGGPAYPIVVKRDIAYWSAAEGATKRHELDIYYSPLAIQHHLRSRVDNGRPGVPVTIHVHGGGWQRGDRVNEWRGAPNAGRAIARHGMIGVCPTYRLSPIAYSGMAIYGPLFSLLFTLIASAFSSWVSSNFLLRWFQIFCAFGVVVFWWRWYDTSKVMHPEPALDVARAVKWVHENLHTIVPEADTERIFLSGHSAGGHLVSLVSLDPKYYKTVGLEDTSFIRGVCCVSAVYNLYQPVHPNPSAVKNFLFRMTYGAAAFGYTKAELMDASPITHVHTHAPPFLLMSAASDMGLENDARAFDQRLTEFGVSHEYHTVANTSHASISSHFEKHQAHQHLFRFIDKCCTDEHAHPHHHRHRDVAASAASATRRPADRSAAAAQPEDDGASESDSGFVEVPTPSPRHASKGHVKKTNSASSLLSSAEKK